MFKSFFSLKVGVNLLITIGLFSVLVWGTLEWLKVHTHHGKEVPVPNVVDMPVHQAVRVLEDMGLDVEVDSFKYEPKYKPLQVLQIYPSAGSRVKEGRTIMLKVNPRTWAKVEVPDVLNKYKGLAFSRLELVGLKVGDTIYEANIQRDAIIRMMLDGNEIKPGTLLPKFSTVDLVIGSGPLRNIAVPNLVGLTVREAREVIHKNHFEVGLVDFFDGTDEDAIVYYQDPSSGSLRDQGMQIDIWASSKSPAEMYSKIKELDRVYRKYELEFDGETDIFSDESKPVIKVEQPVSKPRVEQKETPKEEKPRSKEVENEKKPAPKPTTEKPKSQPAKPREQELERSTARQVIE